MIKASSMQTEPKGKIPPINMVTTAFICQGDSGMKRAIWLVLVGVSIGDALRPTKAPAKTRGAEMHTHKRKRTKMVKKLTAVAAPATLKKMLRIVNMHTKTPGNAVAVIMEFIFQLVASQNL